MNPITKLTIILWALYFVGGGFRILQRAGYAIRNPVNPIASRRAFLLKNWDTILVRSLLTTVAFYYWLQHPNAIETLLGFLHSPLTFNLPATGATAPLFGFFSDALLDQFVSWVRHVPQLSWLSVLLRAQGVPAYQNGQAPPEVDPKP
jgi:hypothetical protein